ncbi:tyrosine-type recombinase/integrase [Streptomyces sp. NPDC091385]|uniref:tyrosine-type recombinase/integrase n=1 Tax=Streptomyces sp. NPDC091385 TaxID=3365997 RepID=UPI0037F91175
MKDPIKEVVLKDGTVHYRFVIDVGKHPNGNRRQLTVTKEDETEARIEYGRLAAAKANGTLILPNKITVDQWMDMWLASREDEIEVTSLNTYTTNLKRVKSHLGHVPIQELTDEQVEDFVKWMVGIDNARHPKRKKPLAITTATATLGIFKDAMARAVTKRLVGVNVAAEITIPRMARKAARRAKPEVRPWNVGEVQRFVAAILNERLYAVHLLSLMGLRPAEVCGLRWVDIDFEAATLSIQNTRTMINNLRVVEKDTKSEAGDRDLPMPGPLVDALRKLKACQAAEKLAAGRDYVDSGYVAVDELGQVLSTRNLREKVYRLMSLLALRRVRLYDARSSCLTYLANNGVPRHILARWAGHSNPRTTEQYYIKPDVEDLRGAADTWAGLHGPAKAAREIL